MEVINDLLDYNNLKIVQNTDWFSFSLDSVLLANFVKVNKNSKIIDFCSGNAPIPLFLSKKVNKKIIGVELQKEIYSMAIKSIKINKLENKIEVLNTDVKDISSLYETDTFDIVTCNPPYFKVEEKSNINQNDVKAIARHELKINLEDVFKVARKILKNNGSIALVHRTNRLIEIIELMKKYNLEPKRIALIYPFVNSNSNLVLIEGRKNGKPGLVVQEPIIVHDKNGNYTKKILNIFSGGKNEN